MSDNFPSESIFDDFFKDDMLKELGVNSREELKYEQGSFAMEHSSNKRYFSNLNISCPKNFELRGDLPIGGNGLITLKTISKVKGRGPKGKSPFSSSGFDAGHILGRQLFKGTCFNTSKKNKMNIYKQTKWSNRGNHYTAVHGYNQTYFENLIVKNIINNPSLIVKYEAKLIYHIDENIPRGIHLRTFCEKSACLNVNVFVPNVEVEGLIDYKSDKRIIVN